MPEGRLISHFKDTVPSTQGSGWNELWENGEQDLWDRGQPSRPLLDYLKGEEALIRAVDHCASRSRALVPGCGLGHDVVMLAQNGFESYGLEVSQAAVNAATKHFGFGADTASHDSRDTGNPGVPGTHELTHFRRGDFFESDWQKALPFEPGQFDLVYDYTFLCALHPTLRKAWADRMGALVKPGRFLVCLEFPLWKDSTLPGPPWGLSGVHWDLLAEGGDGLVSEEAHKQLGTAGNGMFERVQYIRPAVSYPQGRGTDMLSIWRRKQG